MTTTGERERAAPVGVLWTNLGTPAAPRPAEVRRYLRQFLTDRRVVDLNPLAWRLLLELVILPRRGRASAHAYATVWTEAGSPLLANSNAQARALERELGAGFRVATAMRYGEPSIATTLRPLRAAGLRRLLVLPLYPQYSHTTTASVVDAIDAELAVWPRPPERHVITSYHEDDGWLDAVAASITAAQAPAPGERLLLSFHGIPERYAARGDPYPQQCQASAQAIATRLQLPPERWRLAYQSRFGREPWLGPATLDVLRQWARQGVRRVDVACPGFAVDCLETLQEIARQYAQAFVAAGGECLRYLPALNASSVHVEALAGLIARHDAGWVE